MKFGPVPLAEAAGAVLAHSVTVEGRKLKKGSVLGAGELDAMTRAGMAEVIVARLEPGDVAEDEAAARLARALVPDPAEAGLVLAEPFTGRVNILAAGPGVAVLDAAALEAFNRVHPMITIATVPPFRQMAARGMVATVKVISYAVPGEAVARACAAAPAAIRLARPVLRAASLVVTRIPGGPGDEKGIAAIEARLEALEMRLAAVETVPHRAGPLAEALARAAGDLVLILTGSATSDIDDVAPSAVRAAGGRIERFGMPVDPGNLLFLGELAGRPAIGLPGCARSPALNGADWVLSRVACGIPVTSEDIAGMGVGGLLKEIPTRPQPRRGREAG
ncbi:molybdopterin-binding protein [Jhaorihella thermophila]|uniref:Molybdenum cofactor cytidylyltransferase n=1 Tax=Jhaorihella thermophila TaxID=488547 RepID=A0A1H5S065_9RHOB|nr:molybdopterin-binding protein [Jhaorihella thermophila]SEF44013.1 molybdenum cofactor cytidylyltransferase [Jhaorihella thermophila]